MRLIFSHCSDPGLVRPNNQDAYSIDLLDPRGCAALLLVADGMGGYEGGEIASRLAIETVRTRVTASAADWAEKGRLAEGLGEAFHMANRAIIRHQEEQSKLGSMGTTLSAVLIWGDRLLIGHVGDSKVVLVRKGSSSPLTSDHNVPGELLRSGHLTAEQAAVHPQRHVLTRALGTSETLNAEHLELTWQQGDTLLLYTDGLSNMVPQAEIEAITAAGDFTTLAERLVDRANDGGGNDNITVLTARWEG